MYYGQIKGLVPCEIINLHIQSTGTKKITTTKSCGCEKIIKIRRLHKLVFHVSRFSQSHARRTKQMNTREQRYTKNPPITVSPTAHRWCAPPPWCTSRPPASARHRTRPTWSCSRRRDIVWPNFVHVCRLLYSLHPYGSGWPLKASSPKIASESEKRHAPATVRLVCRTCVPVGPGHEPVRFPLTVPIFF